MRFFPLRITAFCIFTLIVALLVRHFYPASVNAHLLGLTLNSIVALIALKSFTWWRTLALLNIAQFIYGISVLDLSFSLFDFYQLSLLLIDIFSIIGVISYAFDKKYIPDFPWKTFSYIFGVSSVINITYLFYYTYRAVSVPEEIPYFVFLSIFVIVLIPVLVFTYLCWLGVWRYAQGRASSGGKTHATQGASV